MKQVTHILSHVKPLLIQSVGITVLAGFHYCANADQSMTSQHITDDQIERAARIAKSTGTHITIVNETTTVNIYGRSKKSNKKIKKSVLKSLKQKKSVKRQETEVLTPPTLANPASVPDKPPMLDHPPTLEEPPKSLKTPVLDNKSSDEIKVY